VGLSEGAVRNRVQALVSSGIIKRFTIETPSTLGVRALVMISVDPSIPTLSVSEGVSKLQGVEKIYEVTGEYDVIIVVSNPNIEGINHAIEDVRMIEGVVKTNTMIVLRTI